MIHSGSQVDMLFCILSEIAVSAFTYRGHGIGLLPSTYCDA
jgi:hypothetical protein